MCAAASSSTCRNGQLAAAGLLALALAGCGGVMVQPDGELPAALIEKVDAKVGVVITPELRDYTHDETRAGVSWQAQLGPGHVKYAEQLFSASFREVQMTTSLDEAKAATGLAAIFEPRIEQYSFATARDTGAGYYAVTIGYRLNVYAPTAELVDSLTVSGYGSAPAAGMSGEKPLAVATFAAMRDAAAKFLVQFPELAVAQVLREGRALTAESAAKTLAASATAADVIETVPIN
ncbi:MAG TPA: hypothetical protein P5528_08745 [Steroidobacteraceae bacterium]|nr:hypothetical protein [Steroidobacteraceae bacterium]